MSIYQTPISSEEMEQRRLSLEMLRIRSEMDKLDNSLDQLSQMRQYQQQQLEMEFKRNRKNIDALYDKDVRIVLHEYSDLFDELDDVRQSFAENQKSDDKFLTTLTEGD